MTVKDWIIQLGLWIGIISGLIGISIFLWKISKWIIKKYHQQNQMIRPHSAFRFLKKLFGKKKASIEIYKFPPSKEE